MSGQAISVNTEKEHSIADIRQNYKKYFSSPAELNSFLADFGIEWSKKRLSIGVAGKIQDRILVQLSNALDHLIKTENELIERLKEIYVLMEPSFSGSDNQVISNVIKDNEELKEYALYAQSTIAARKHLENTIKEKAKQVMPNFSAVVEPLIAAKLLAMAGSLQRLASMTSSTIQLLGAEKALFRHLKDRNARSPKYGLIYNSKYVQQAPDNLKGKAARILASKLMLAARIDNYSKRDESQKMVKELNEELSKMKHDGTQHTGQLHSSEYADKNKFDDSKKHQRRNYRS